MNIPWSGAALAAILAVACTPDEPRPVTAAPPQPVAAGQPAPGEELDGEAYFALVRGNTIEGTGPRANFTIYIAEDGTQRMVWQTMRSSGRDEGRIVIRDGKACSSWRLTRGGEEACGRIFRDGETFRGVDRETGAVTSTFRILPGNPRRL